MENFTMYNPVKLYFGLGVLKNLPASIEKYGKRVLLVYGKTSIKRTGLYDVIMDLLDGFEVVEYSGIKPNPLAEDVDEAAKMGREAGVDVVLAVGGGSVIDSAKMISLGIKANHGVWDFMSGKQKPKTAIPMVAVLTLAATGTEMNMFAVLQNKETRQKFGYGSPLIYPAESFLDPGLTYSVPADYTAYGMVDLIAHVLEAYFGEGNAPLSDKIVFSIIRETTEYASDLLDNPTNYELRARMMYAATLALNGLTSNGRKYGDWGVHALGHALSMLFDTAHGASLSLVYPAWMKLFENPLKARLELLGKEVFGVHSSSECIQKMEDFFHSIGSPVRLEQADIDIRMQQQLLDYYHEHQPNGRGMQLTKDDYKVLVDLMK